MEENKKNQVQALDDDMLENVTGGWTAIRIGPAPKVRYRYMFTDSEINKLNEAGCKSGNGEPLRTGTTVDVTVCDASGKKLKPGAIRAILGEEEDWIDS